jgi:lipopolysaccharide/colanic/teichoic acid biosynthesis glycosyltransferase
MTRIIERLIDIGAGSLGLVLLAPVLMFVAGVIYFVDGRPVLIPETWIDRRGRSITLLAFRTDRLSLDSHEHPMPLPWIGLFLRRSSIDKLPRWWNVLRGDCHSDVFWF